MTGDLHHASAAGEPSCRSKERAPRLTANVRLVDCAGCRESRGFNSALRYFLLGRARRMWGTAAVHG